MAKRVKKTDAKKEIKEKKKNNKKVIEEVQNKLDENRSVTLPRDLYYEMRTLHLEMDKIVSDMQRATAQMEAYEKSRILAGMERNDLKARKKMLESSYAEFILRVKREKGIDIKGKTINPESLEVMA